MFDKMTGSCLCGAVHLSCGGKVGAASYCHCNDCRKCTGSAFSVSVAFDACDVQISNGPIGSHTKTADNGHELTRYFCLNCGSPLYTSSPRHPDRIYVKAGILDDASLVRPAYQSWTCSKVSWSRIDPALPAYAGSRP